MRLIHTSDWHLGRSFHGESLQSAHEQFLDHLVVLTRDADADAVLVSGDIYDRALPNPVTVKMLDDALNRLLDTGARIILTSGNHDSAIRLGFGSRVLEHAGLFIRTDLSAVGRPIPVPNRSRADELAGHVVTVPYLEPSVVAPVLEASASTHAGVLDAALSRARQAVGAKADLPTAVMAHAFFAGATTTESERDICVGGLGVAPQSLLTGFDYAALGHLHRPQTLAPSIRYSGSPVAMSFSEAGQTKGTWLVDAPSAGVEPTAEFVAAPAYRDVRVLEGTLDELLADPHLASAEDAWCQVTLTDEIRPAEAMDRIRARFPHTLRLLFAHRPIDGAPATYAQRVQGRSDLELCSDFLAHVRGGRGPSATERTAIGEAVAAALREEAAAPETDTLLPIEGLS